MLWLAVVYMLLAFAFYTFAVFSGRREGLHAKPEAWTLGAQPVTSRSRPVLDVGGAGSRRVRPARCHRSQRAVAS